MSLLPQESADGSADATVAAAPSEAHVAVRLSLDQSPPAAYASDHIGLLVQSSTKLLLYWNHAHDPFDPLRKALGADAMHYRLIARLVDVDSNDESFYEATPARLLWVNVKPGRSYQAHVGFYAAGRPSIRLMTSAVARTPSSRLSSTTDPVPDFSVPPPSLVVMLNEAGYRSDALEAY